MTEFDSLEVTITGVEDDVCNITLGKSGESHGTTGLEFFDELRDAIRAASTNDGVRVIVIEGRGDNFSVGGDVEEMKERIDGGPSVAAEWWRDLLLNPPGHIDAILDCPKPILTKIDGYAVGGGAVLATISDISIASSDAKIGDTHLNIGYSAPDSPPFWPMLIGVNKAKELLMTGELIDAEEAAEIGLINHAVPPEELDERVDEMVDRLASRPQYAMYYSKLMVNKWLKLAFLFVNREAHAHEAITEFLPDHKHAVEAFLADEPRNFPSARGSDDEST